MKKLAVLFLGVLVVACESTTPEKESDADNLHKQVQDTIAAMQKKDPALKEWFGDKSYGYAMFPSVAKAGIGIGGAYGRGEVYEGSKMIGYSKIEEGTIGLQLGAQEFAELIFFKDEAALKNFIRGNFEFGAQATAVAVDAGAATKADYDKGVAVFLWSKAGLMAEASIGGQKFVYEAKK